MSPVHDIILAIFVVLVGATTAAGITLLGVIARFPALHAAGIGILSGLCLALLIVEPRFRPDHVQPTPDDGGDG